MDINIKETLFNEISFFKQSYPLIKIRVIVLVILILSILLLVILGFFDEYIPNSLYNYAYLLKQDYYIFMCVLPIIICTFFISINNKIDDKINNIVAKYLGINIQTSSEISPINFELLPNKLKNIHFKKSLKTVTEITGKNLLYNFFFNLYTNSKFNCVINCLYQDINYDITVLNTYWEIRKRAGRIVYVEDYGTDYFAVISFGNKYFDIENIELLNKIPIEYSGYKILPDNKINLLIEKKYKIKIKGKLVEKINKDIELAEEVIEKAIILAEYIIDNNKKRPS